ncbi:MAG: NAD(P)-dependent oxidoreductase [Acidobacteria bacterium]|nr:NAD(P)-dependent oxidoreductase [Acidobacteriota bacterium]
MFSDRKILITGPAGQIAFPMARDMARDNEVWGIARFSDADSRAMVEAVGVRTLAVDLGDPDFSELPDDFDYVLHLAVAQVPGWDFDAAFRTNAEGTGLLLHHCRRAKAALVMSTHSVYRPPADGDPWHVFQETDPLGEVNAAHAPTYSMSKIAQEAVSRTCARLFDLPVTIARMNASYGPDGTGGLPVMQMDALMAGNPVTTRWDPCMYMPIHTDDITAQAEALLDAASVHTTIVNWAGDEPASVQEWCAYIGELAGITPVVNAVEQPGTLRGSVTDNTRRASFTGPCTVGWREGIRSVFEARYGDRA